MSLTAKHYLDIYRTRKTMQEEGVTDPSDEIKQLTASLVEKFASLDESEEIDLVKINENLNQFIVTKTGEVLAEIERE